MARKEESVMWLNLAWPEIENNICVHMLVVRISTDEKEYRGVEENQYWDTESE